MTTPHEAQEPTQDQLQQLCDTVLSYEVDIPPLAGIPPDVDLTRFVHLATLPMFNEDIVPPDSSIEHQERQDNVDSYSHADSDPLSHTNDRWTGNPEMDRAMLVARALAVNLFPKS